MQYRYAGPHPVEDEAGVLVHPGDVREMDEPPPWGPWDPVPHFSGELPETPAVPSAVPSALPADPPADPPAKPAAPAAQPEGM